MSYKVTQTTEGRTTVEVRVPQTELTETEHSFTYTLPSDSTEGINIEVTNILEGVPDTGVILDSLPYVLIIALVAAAVLVVVIKKRRSIEDEE